MFEKKELIEYAALFTDGKQVVAIEFDEQGRNLYRSYLLLDEELEVLEIGERLEEKEVTYQIVSHHLIENYLTRSEEAMKRYLVKELKSTYQNKNVNKLQYLYSEYFEEDDRDPKIMYQRLMDSLQATLDEKHHQLYQLLKLSHTKKQV